MRNFVLLVVLSLISSYMGNSQVYRDSGNHGLMLLTTKENNEMNKLQGSPYLEEDFQYGMVSVEGKEPLEAFLRFNVHEEQMEIKLDQKSEEIYSLPNKKTTHYKVGPQIFMYESVNSGGKRTSGYFIEHFNGEKFRLLEKPVATISEAVKAQTGYDKDRPAQINIEEDYYVFSEDGQVQKIPLKHRDLKKIFNSPVAKNYLSDNKIRSEQDLISFISWLDNQ